ncbi:MAG: dITP/XTP pyrophosphatase [Candidatus Berkelbacteria bacterium Gr01-1014_85]|uniref:DITP/XTP pyrophosphatase n=1 Tax=Candidatus Berkelbacteria bacterium Gr01-1014_85 TaxID=2017150 RepID=A0A554J9P3_9BACT|nr:MAG: dITP/XTP pyrophosphatase [Candidatus Berkelbacteria bacterium Gr01-1014_85]
MLDVEENGKTFEENAIIKALSFSQHYDGYVIATDGGASIPALGESWDGLRTKRFAGEEATDQERIEKLLTLMKDKKDNERAMLWREAIAVARNGQVLFSEEVEGAKGEVQASFDPTKYKPGIWVCSIWYFPELNKNFFDMTEKEQEYVEISWHRLFKSTRNYFEKHL